MKRNMVGYCAASFAVVLAEFLFQSAWAVDVQMNGDTNVAGGLTASSFTGSGAGLTGIPGSAISNTSVTVNQLADSAVTSAKLANDAVTPTKIAFYSRVAIVAITGGDYADPSTAMADYSTWCPSPSSSNPCLLKIMPGVYDVGSSSVTMQQYIDIEGSGEKITKVASTNVTGTVQGASNAEIRFLTVANTGGNSTRAIYNSSASPSILHVTATASGGITNNFGVYNTNSSVVMTNVTITASGTSGYGVANAGTGTVKINHSVISGTGNTIYNTSGVITLVSHTQLDGGAVFNGGTLTCVGAYNSSYVALGTNCQ